MIIKEVIKKGLLIKDGIALVILSDNHFRTDPGEKRRGERRIGRYPHPKKLAKKLAESSKPS